MTSAYGYTPGDRIFDAAGEPGRVLQIDTIHRRLRVAWRHGTTWAALADLDPTVRERRDRQQSPAYVED